MRRENRLSVHSRVSFSLRPVHALETIFCTSKTKRERTLGPKASSQAGKSCPKFCDAWWKFYPFFIGTGTFTEMVTFLWFLRIVKVCTAGSRES